MRLKFTLVLICSLLLATLLPSSVFAADFTHTVTNITENSITVEWTSVSGAEKYYAQIGGVTYHLYPPFTYRYTYSNLQPNTSYSIRIACKVGSLYYYTTSEIVTTLAGAEFTVDTATGTITEYTGSGTNVTIPSNINGTDILIIGSGAFDGCNTVETVTISSGITTIENTAFDNCTALTEINIPDTVNSIGNRSFGVCPSLTSVNVDGSNSTYTSNDGVLNNKSMTLLIYYPAGKTQSNYSVPDGIGTIAPYAFHYNSNIQEVTMYSDVTTIQDSAFYGCMNLQSAIMASSVTSIANNAFMYYDAGSSSDANLPNLTIYGQNGSFADTYAASRGIPFDQASWYDFTYTDNGNGTCTITDYTGDDINVSVPGEIDDLTVVEIAASTFEDNNTIETITLSATVERIEKLTFSSCNSLTDIYVKSENSYFESDNGILFSADGTLLICYPHARDASSYNVPSGVETIEEYAFGNVLALTSVTINGPSVISDTAFYYCTNLESATIYESVITIADSAFMYYNFPNQTDEPLPNLTIHGQADSAAQLYAQNHNIPFQEIVVDDNYDYASLSPTTCKITKYNGSSPNVVIPDTINGMTVVEIGDHSFNGMNLDSVTIPDTVTAIRENAFRRSDLEYLTIGNSVQIIEFGAFSYNNLTTLIIPDSVTELGEQVFACNKIENLTFPSSVTEMGFAIFRANEITTINGSPSDGIIYYRHPDGSDNYTKINSYGGASDVIDFIPSTVTWIEPFAFMGCGITSVTIPDSVYYIGPATFNDNAITTLDGQPSNGIIHGRYMNDELGIGAYDTTLIKSYGGVSDYIDFIPSNVTDIGQNAFQSNGIYYVELPNSINNIDHAAFCENDIEEIIINNGTQHIGNWAFGNNPIINIAIPSTVTSMDNGVFSSDTTGLVIYGSNGTTAASYANNNGITFVSVEDFSYSDNGDGTSTITGYSGSLSHVYIPPAMADASMPVTCLYQTFKQNDNVVSVRYPYTLKEIGFEAFAECNGITEVIVPDHIEAIGESVFMECDNLTSVTIGNSVTLIDDYAFINSYNIESITLGRSLEEIGDNVFVSVNKIKTLILPDSLTTLGTGTISYCMELKSIVIPSSVTNIAADAIKNCEQLTIVGEHGSAAEIYADTNSIPFIGGVIVDLNGDMTVDMLDVVLAAENYGGTSSDFDVTGDGRINIYDLVALGRII